MVDSTTVKDEAFSKTLREWRGKRRQKEAAAILGVPLETFKCWEYAKQSPRDSFKAYLLEKMKSEEKQAA